MYLFWQGRGEARGLIEGCIFIYASSYIRLISFEIGLISKEIIIVTSLTMAGVFTNKVYT